MAAYSVVMTTIAAYHIKEHTMQKFIAYTIIIIVILFATSFTQALQIGLNQTFSGTTPQGITPWLQATFTNINSNTVRLTMAALNLTTQEFIGSWYFNFKPGLSLSNLNFIHQSGIQASSISKATNGYKADGTGGYYDFKFNFTANSFNAGQTSIYDITYSSSIDHLFFNFKSAESNDPTCNDTTNYTSAAHIQAIGITGNSGWITNGSNSISLTQVVEYNAPVPEPSTYVLIGLGIFGLYLRRKMRTLV